MDILEQIYRVEKEVRGTPKLPMNHKTTLKKWEYLFFSLNEFTLREDETLLDYLNELGEEGWELVSVTPEGENHYQEFYFKRQV